MTDDPIKPERLFFESYFKGRTGRLLEIGAFTGVRSSLTLGLIQSGWEAVLVEPNPSCFRALIENHGQNPKVHLVNAAISDFDGLASFWDDDGGEVSTLLKRHADLFSMKVGTKYVKYTTAVVTPKTLLNYFGGPSNWNLVVIDVEGTNRVVVENMPLSVMFDTEIICVEHEVHTDNVLSALNKHYNWLECYPPNIVARCRK